MVGCKNGFQEAKMLNRIRNYVIFALIIAGFYYLLSHHFVFTSWDDFDVLKKNELTFKYTFFSLSQLSPKQVLRIDELRDAGIGDILVERGRITEGELIKISRDVEKELE